MPRVDRAARRRAQRARSHRQLVVATCTGWCATEEDLEDCRRATHDALLSMLGPLRRSGVSWTWCIGPDALEHLEVLEEQGNGSPVLPELADHYRQCRALLREYGGFIVTAMADAVPA